MMIYAEGHAEDDVFVCASCGNAFHEKEFVNVFINQTDEKQLCPECGHHGCWRYTKSDYERQQNAGLI